MSSNNQEVTARIRAVHLTLILASVAMVIAVELAKTDLIESALEEADTINSISRDISDFHKYLPGLIETEVYQLDSLPYANSFRGTVARDGIEVDGRTFTPKLRLTFEQYYGVRKRIGLTFVVTPGIEKLRAREVPSLVRNLGEFVDAWNILKQISEVRLLTNYKGTTAYVYRHDNPDFDIGDPDPDGDEYFRWTARLEEEICASGNGDWRESRFIQVPKAELDQRLDSVVGTVNDIPRFPERQCVSERVGLPLDTIYLVLREYERVENVGRAARLLHTRSIYLPLEDEELAVDFTASLDPRDSKELREFQESFPSISRVLEEYKDIDIAQLPVSTTDGDNLSLLGLLATLKRLVNQGSIEVAGLKAPANLVYTWGSLVLTSLLAYLLIHLRALGRIARDGRLEVGAWVGLYDDSLARLVTFLSTMVLPGGTVFYLASLAWAEGGSALIISTGSALIAVPIYFSMWGTLGSLSRRRGAAEEV